MKKIRIGILGYGNLGKSVEEEILKDDRFRLVCIFSRREITSRFRSHCDKFENISNYKRKIDIIILCSGSKTDIEEQAFLVAKNFHTIDSFDNHAHIEDYCKKLNEQNRRNKKCSIISCGWDPGLFSIARAIFTAVDTSQETFWGKGVSQGHSQALRELKGVEDAIEFTIPNKKAIKQAIAGNKPEEKSKHKRLCFVSCAKGVNKKELCKKIRNMPDYFAGYKTLIKFCNKKKINGLKLHMFHRGFVITPNGQMKFELNLKSNPKFTARVVIAFCIALSNSIKNKEFGAKTILDIPLSYLFLDRSYMDLI
ncbi:MAG: diaminopimelate dehydrogenase [Christensenellales bacterium]